MSHKFYARLKEDMAGYKIDDRVLLAIVVPKGTIVNLGSYTQMAVFDGTILYYNPEKRTELFEILE